MGRNAAGASFLRGFLIYARTDAFWVQIENKEHADYFAQAVRLAGRQEPVNAVTNASMGSLAATGTVYYPGPDIGQQAWRRSAYGHGAWSLCGITHTTSSSAVMDSIAGLLSDPVQPWDAVICTSTAVKDNVLRVLQAQTDYLVARFGVQKLVLPQLPIIPLGIHCDDFVFSAEEKFTARHVVGAAPDDLVVLFMGRLSFHAKAHPLALYQALEKAAKTLTAGRQVVLVECGWHANEFIAEAYRDAAQKACPGVRVVMLDGRVAENRQTAWACADVFCSLSDNIQETFGLTPIEAMAAGLPVVVSNWDGYKDTVRDGVDGFCIPTLTPGARLGGDLAQRHALGIDTYDMYCGHVCSFVAVDIEATSQAFTRMFSSPELRQQMGEAGRQRAREVYDWSVIIPQYENLWEQLAEIRREKAPELKPLPHPWPARLDPFHAFASYPTLALHPQMQLALVDADCETALARFDQYKQLTMVNFANEVLPSRDEVRAVMEAAAYGPRPAVELIQSIPPQRQAVVFRALAWLMKLGLLRATY